MSQAASGRKNRPWEDDDTQEGSYQHRPQPNREQPYGTENSEPHSVPQSLPNPQQSHYGYGIQRNPSSQSPATIAGSSSEQHEVWIPGRAAESTRHPTTLLNLVTESPEGSNQRSRMPPAPPTRSLSHSTHDGNHGHQLPKRRRLSDDDETHPPDENSLNRRPPYHQSQSSPHLPQPAPQYSQYSSSPNIQNPNQTHQILQTFNNRSIPIHSGTSLGPSPQLRHAPPPPPPPPPPAQLPPSSNMRSDSWRAQLPYTPSVPIDHSSGYSYPHRRPSPKLPTPPEGYPPPPPPPLPPPPPPPPSFVVTSERSVNNARKSSDNYPPSSQLSSRYNFHHTPPAVPDLETQNFHLSQENDYLRAEIRRIGSEFVPGNNLRGIVAQLFEVVEDYAEVVANQQQQVQVALDTVENVRTSGGAGGPGVSSGEIPVPRRKAVLDKDLMTQESVVACLRGMHTTLRSKLNTLKRVGVMKTKVDLMERSVVGRVTGGLIGGPSQENETYRLKLSQLEQEKARLKDRVEVLVRENERYSRSIQTSEPGPLRFPTTPSNQSRAGSQPSSPNQQPPFTQHRSTPAPISPSTVTIALSTVPSTAIYNETLATLQHRLSVTQLELETLQAEHTRLRAAIQRSQQRATTLEKKHAVSNEENDILTTERDRYQMLYEAMEEQLAEVTASRDEFRRQAVAGGGQYTNILAMATKLEMKGVEDRKRWKEEKEALEKEKEEIMRVANGKEREIEKLQEELGKLKHKVNQSRMREGQSGFEDMGEKAELLDLFSGGQSQENQTSPEGLELANQVLHKRISFLESTIKEMRCESLGIMRAAERLVAAGQALE